MSPIINGNFDEAGNTIEPGKYAARIDKVETKISKQPDHKEMLAVTFTLTAEPNIGRKVWANIMTQAASLWKLKQLAEACGIDMAGRQDFDSDELLGQELGITVVDETYEGVKRSKVQSFFQL